ncbi:MAG TPA: flagellar biosynthetic protein FliQ [Bryobacteraceae bacterium]|jgi:flagellar biosynthesis protein FliQ|nr:flagellar biosynthetic protein FliQ [Bryobacteraceae bacterium]
MTPESVIHLIREALLAAFWISAPLLAIGLSVGIVMNMVQVATSLQDNAFSTFPRLAAFLAGLTMLMPWMLKQWTGYMIRLCGEIAHYGH